MRSGCDRDGAVDYEGCEGIVNNIAKEKWEALPHPIIIDSGATTSVLPMNRCSHVETRETEGSRSGHQLIAANKIYNRGEKTVTMMTKEGLTRNMKFTSCDVERALGSASGICQQGRQGHTVFSTAPITPMAATFTTSIQKNTLSWPTRMGFMS